MSLPDHLLTEDDEYWCEDHRAPRPCRACRVEFEMEQAEWAEDMKAEEELEREYDERESNP